MIAWRGNVLLSIIIFVLRVNRADSQISGQSYKTDFCSLHQKVVQGEVKREEALKGQNIAVSIPEEIDPSNLYVAYRMLDEVARRAGFSYTPYVTGYPKSNETWTDLLKRTTKDYDLAVDWWARTAERVELGIVFPETWYDFDTVLVTKKPPQDEGFIFWVFSYPFSPGLWILTVFTICITGLLYYILDFLHEHADRSKLFSCVEGCIFTSFDSFTGRKCAFAPKSRATRIIMISMAFLYLILISAYTANLTNYYIFKSRPAISITDVNDVIRNNLLVCATRGYANSESLKSQYIKVRVLEVESDKEQLIALSEGRCNVALITLGSFEAYKKDKTVNANCDMEWVGRRVFVAGAGFALQDSEQYCSSLLDNVLDYHLLQMRREGKIQEILEIDRTRENSQETCEDEVVIEENRDNSLKISNMAGAFTFHLCLAVISILVALYDLYYQPKIVKQHMIKELRSTILSANTHLISSSLSTEVHEKGNDCKKLTEGNTSTSIVSKGPTDLTNKDNKAFLKLMRMIKNHNTGILQDLETQKKELVKKLESQKAQHKNTQDKLLTIKCQLRKRYPSQHQV